MKSVVSSLVALVIAIAPVSAIAKPAQHAKTANAKVTSTPVKHKADKGKKGRKADKHERRADRAAAAPDKCDKSARSARVREKASKKDVAKGVLHHAHIDVGEVGHGEPKVDKGVLVAASMKAPIAREKARAKPAAARADTAPKPSKPNADRPRKGGAEKGARKPAAKTIRASDDGSGEPARDEAPAELVARDRKTSKKDVKAAKSAAPATKPPCKKTPVEVVRGPELARFELTKCDGTVAPLAVERLSILVRPGGAARPTTPLAELATKPGPELAKGIRRVDPRLIERIQAVVDRFGAPGVPTKLSVISGYRPGSVGSMHSSGRAIDFRVEGVKNEDIVTFCKTLPDTGCGFYPNSSFVHIDVRDSGAGHVSWIDVSGPGEAPRYVSVWPLPPSSADEQHLRRASATQRTFEELAAEGEELLRAKRPFDPSGLEGESMDDHPAEAEVED